MKAGQCRMQPEDAPPGFWRDREGPPALIDGVELESRVPTRFFQSLDAYPPEWGRLTWRVQLNRIVAGSVDVPMFRTFYPGAEWNLRQRGDRWFLTAWFRWEGPGPSYGDLSAAGSVHVAGDTAVFRFAWLPSSIRAEPDFARPLVLRSRIDARERRHIAETVRSQREQTAASDPSIIVLDDIIEVARAASSSP